MFGFFSKILFEFLCCVEYAVSRLKYFLDENYLIIGEKDKEIYQENI